jgi:nickel-dependent lactate racemase
VSALHSLAFLEDPGTRPGSTKSNRFHLALEAIANTAGLAFVLNVALGAEGETVGVAAGLPGDVLPALIKELSPYTWTSVGDAPYDAALVGIAEPKDANLYQTSRGLTYLAAAPRPAVRDGGWVVLASRCHEGIGRGPAEAEFLNRMSAGDSAREVLSNLKQHEFGAGGQRAFMLAKALLRYRGMVVGALMPDEIAACHVVTEPNGAPAVERLREELGKTARILVVPNPFSSIPSLGTRPNGTPAEAD